ncbi:BREX-1 system adenine-specific DNA-methyltransferase PglX [Paenarthrobacter sp. AT5]|uniref:BREX-1 system adenine-specific DNA-methyltransferase PglX n=1 Tax=Paenarthrobacter sp. AT5 TaxID=2973089 RepID=UPI0029344238|nr:BREX-1 system adenine-specific DNA-methyltransferase PglX [Paenarthrobacter sp. AT5]WOC59197.1 BREX-1 system adenine-specific DNA-methyltransferase PglX [Paenarthrobacter sp. AT5]
METAPLKSFATWARTALIREVSARISVVLASEELRQEQPNAVAALEKAVNAAGGSDKGRDTVADKVAYTWFNRIIALRFMDAKAYTGIGVVSPERGREGGQPEVLAEAKRGNIDSTVVTNKRTAETVTSLLNGMRRSDNPQGEAYALLLAEYCRHWNRSMPFMFEREGDYTELLIPANLLADDSVLARAVEVLTEEVCQDVEVIGWLYQFYISERKDEVFAGFKKNKKAGRDEIPAATQLFTPHWIVRYLVENSLGRLWMLNRPNSGLVHQMDYYVAPVGDEADFLNVRGPEELKVIDPACGSGHMLTYAFDLLYAIYEEEGYAPSDIPGLILGNNLYGTEIDPRAGALAAFALSMKARERQRTFLNPGKGAVPNICVLEPVRFSQDELGTLLTRGGDKAAEEKFWQAYDHADTFGSLICPDQDLTGPLAHHLESLGEADTLFFGDLLARARTVIRQSEYLSTRYHVVVANPPYMGNRNATPKLSDFAKQEYPASKSDLFAMFIERSLLLALRNGSVAMITMQSWMFLSSFALLRNNLLSDCAIISMAHLGTGAFDTVGGEVVGASAFVLHNDKGTNLRGVYFRVIGGRGEKAKSELVLAGIKDPTLDHRFERVFRDFSLLPGTPIAYWLRESEFELFGSAKPLGGVAEPRKGMDTGWNDRFLRLWHEVSFDGLRLDKSDVERKWVPYNKGGGVRRWYGYRDYVINWQKDGKDIKARLDQEARKPTIRNEKDFFREGFTYSTVASSFSARWSPDNAIFDNGGCTVFANHGLNAVGSYLNSRVARRYFAFLAPTLNYQPGDVARLPLAPGLFTAPLNTQLCIDIAKEDWDSYESSWDFQRSPLLNAEPQEYLSEAVKRFQSRRLDLVSRLKELESRDEVTLGALYGADDHISADSSDGSVTLFADPTYRFGNVEDSELSKLQLATDMSELISFAVGCMFGRFSLDAPGLVLANQGDTLERYLAEVPVPSFVPDKDNVLPVLTGSWFEDDIVERFRAFLKAAFGDEHLDENLRFVEEALGKDIRKYFVQDFYKDHVQRYRKRPIYWLFSSSKGSFNALIYMHRYTPSTVSTVLNEYLREFKAKLDASRQHQERLAAGAGTPRQQAAALKEVDRLRKVLLELDEYEHDVLYPLASQQVQIDLDDGVKANYLKLGVALKKIPGLEASDE